jgi:hypothetical protein
MIYITVLIYAVQRFDCVQAPTTTKASIRKPAPLVGLVEPLVGGPILRWMRWCFITFLPGFRLSSSFGINAMY